MPSCTNKHGYGCGLVSGAALPPSQAARPRAPAHDGRPRRRRPLRREAPLPRRRSRPSALPRGAAVAARRGATLAVFLRAHLRGSRSRRERRAPPPAIGAGAATSIGVARDADEDTRTRNRSLNQVGHLGGFGSRCPIAHSSETPQSNPQPDAQRRGDASRRNAHRMKGEK
jgi:hypothetical protein